jgi:SAM-dependent methyltransferase
MVGYKAASSAKGGQTLSIASKIGMLDKIKNYVCMSDSRKTVMDLTKELDITGKVWVVHNEIYSDNALPPIGTVLERGSLNSVAHEEIAFDNILDSAHAKLKKFHSESIDLVTMNQGLHHIPPEKLHGFLTQVMRILRPGGIFIIHGHDLELNESEGKVRYSMLDLAHRVFKAVTDVSVQDEIEE